jgi:hypothetical protein
MAAEVTQLLSDISGQSLAEYSGLLQQARPKIGLGYRRVSPSDALSGIGLPCISPRLK